MRPQQPHGAAGSVSLAALATAGPASPSVALDVLVATTALGLPELSLDCLAADETGAVWADTSAVGGPATFRAPGSRHHPTDCVYAGAAIAACVGLGAVIPAAPPSPMGHARWLARIHARLAATWRDEPAGRDAVTLLVRCLSYDPTDRPLANRLGLLARSLGVSRTDDLFTEVARAPFVSPPRAPRRHIASRPPPIAAANVEPPSPVGASLLGRSRTATPPRVPEALHIAIAVMLVVAVAELAVIMCGAMWVVPELTG